MSDSVRINIHGRLSGAGSRESKLEGRPAFDARAIARTSTTRARKRSKAMSCHGTWAASARWTPFGVELRARLKASGFRSSCGLASKSTSFRTGDQLAIDGLFESLLHEIWRDVVLEAVTQRACRRGHRNGPMPLAFGRQNVFHDEIHEPRRLYSSLAPTRRH